LSEPYVGATNKLIVMVSQPILGANGEYKGFIGGSIRLHETNIFQAVLGTTSNQMNGSYAYVVSDSGKLLFHPDETRIGENVLGNKAVDMLVTGESGMMRVLDTSDVDMLASYSFMKEAGWGIVAQTPYEIVQQSARKLVLKLVLKLILYMIPALLAFMLIIYWVIGTLSEPLSKLANFASKLSPNQVASDEIPKIHAWNYEANELHKAFGRAVRHFRYQFENLSLEAQTDALTGLFNRRTMDRWIKNWISQEAPFSILVMDIDNFKQVNDTYGHEKGDEVLKFLAQSLLRLSGDGNICCRFGGEEFVVLVLNDELDVAIQHAETIRKHMSETNSPTGSTVTLSIGIAHYPEMSHNAEQLFRYADEAMYRAKRLGRNRIELGQASDFEEKTS
jgi:diguanylate cyclase (GGDEF)-like protein